MTNRVALTALLIAGLTSAHQGCSGHSVARRNPGGPVKRDLTWQQVAQMDAQQSCTGYSYAPWTPIASTYPTIWETASIVPGDTTAQALFSTINSTVNSKLPNIQPRGTHMGDWTGVNTTGLSAPDVCWWTMGGCTQPASGTGLKADITTVPEPNTWGYGFDDGPNCSHNAFYDYLQSQNQKASMFFIGSNVADWPLQAVRAVQDGHHICVHTWSHQYMTSFSNEQAFAELYYTRKVIKDILGVTPKCWRPPFGDVDNRIRMIAEGLNLTNIVWSDDTDDWREGAAVNPTPPSQVTANYQSVIDRTKNGTYNDHGPVVLTHELTNFTMQEAVQMYPQIKAAFKYMVPIAVAYNWTTPYAETNITYPNFAQYISGKVNASNSQTPSNLSDANTTISSGAGTAQSSGASTAQSFSTAAKATANVDAKSGAIMNRQTGSGLLGMVGCLGLAVVALV